MEASPYFTRQEIESGALAGNELVWLANRWNAYVITVQGSARLRLTDGRIMEVGYAGINGYPYPPVSPGQQMIADGVIAKQDLSLETMRRYFDAHPESMDKYLWLNPRTVFFTEVHGGPYGSLNVPVTRLASIATDKDVYPPAMVAFLSVPIPAMDDAFPGGAPMSSQREFAGFLLDQDRGGAIRSAGRCDIYMGIGDRAGQTAGHQLNPGALYYLAGWKPDAGGEVWGQSPLSYVNGAAHSVPQQHAVDQAGKHRADGDQPSVDSDRPHLGAGIFDGSHHLPGDCFGGLAHLPDDALGALPGAARGRHIAEFRIGSAWMHAGDGNELRGEFDSHCLGERKLGGLGCGVGAERGNRTPRDHG